MPTEMETLLEEMLESKPEIERTDFCQFLTDYGCWCVKPFQEQVKLWLLARFQAMSEIDANKLSRSLIKTDGVMNYGSYAKMFAKLHIIQSNLPIPASRWRKEFPLIVDADGPTKKDKPLKTKEKPEDDDQFIDN